MSTLHTSRSAAFIAAFALTAATPASAQGAQPVCSLEEARLLAADGAAGDVFGQAIALEADVLAVGASGDDDLGSDSGSLYVFVRAAAAWTQGAKLVASDGQAGDRFGAALALSSGSLLAGAFGDDDAGADAGSAYVFTFGAAWSQQAKLIAFDGAPGDQFGRSVGLAGDTAVIGAPLDDDGGPDSGSAYVFVRFGTLWQSQGKLVAADASGGDQFATSVAISGDRILVGAPLAGGSGAAYVYVRSGSTWTQEAKLVALNAAGGDRFGRAVGLDGDDAAIGAPLDDALGADSGSLRVFSRIAGTWTPVAELLASDGAPADLLGWSAAISSGRAVAGAVWDDDRGDKSGAAYVFVRGGAGWAQASKLLPSAGAAYDSFGVSTAISGASVAVGAYQNSVMGNGSAYALRLLDPPAVYCTAKPNSCGGLPAISFSGSPSASLASGFTLRASGARESKTGLVLYGNSGPASLPFQGGTLCVAASGLKRGVPVVAAGGTPGPLCDAQLALDWNAFAAGQAGGNPAPFLRVPGTTVHVQWWGRDTPSQSLLSDALTYDACP